MKRTGVAVVRSLEGALLRDDELIQIGDKVKGVLLEGKSTLLVFADASPMTQGHVWRTCTKEQLRRF